MTRNSETGLLIIMGLMLVASGVLGWQNEKELEAQASLWRDLYRQASAESKLTDCVEVDANYVICKKARHGEKR